MPIQLVTFDLDDTLWESRPVLLSAELAMVNWLQAHRPLLAERFTPEQLRQFKDEVAKTQPQLAHRVSQLRREALRLALQAAGYDSQSAEQGAEQAFAAFHLARQQVTFYDSVLPTLATLKNHYRLAAITNGNADAEHLGLMHYFDFALSADEVGVKKPAPDLFHAALERAGCGAAEAVHVGDHPLDDMEGARACGIRTVWANFRQLPWQEEWRPSAEIHHWRELVLTLQRLES